MSDLGKRIYVARKALNLTLEVVGDYVGVGKSTVRKWENGIIKNMRQDKVKKLSEILQVPPEYLLGWTDDPVDHNLLSNREETVTKPDDGPSLDDMQLLKMFHEADEQKKAAIRILLGLQGE